MESLGHLRDALADALEEVTSETDALLLEGFEVLPLEAYEPIREMEKRAIELGYFELDGEDADCA